MIGLLEYIPWVHYHLVSQIDRLDSQPGQSWHVDHLSTLLLHDLFAPYYIHQYCIKHKTFTNFLLITSSKSFSAPSIFSPRACMLWYCSIEVSHVYSWYRLLTLYSSKASFHELIKRESSHISACDGVPEVAIVSEGASLNNYCAKNGGDG